MKVLVATRDTQKQRASDFCFVEEGDLVYFGTICGRDEYAIAEGNADGGCGCGRSLTGTLNLKGTTTVKVVEQDRTIAEYGIALLAARQHALEASRALDHDDVADVEAQAMDLLRVAKSYPVGTVLEYRLRQFAVRRAA